MDYGTLLGDSWGVTWRHKYLWLLGLFSFGGSCSVGNSYSFGSEDVPGAGDGTGDLGGVGDFIASHAGLLLALLAAFLLLGLVVFVLSFLATAGLIAGVDEAHAGRRRSLGFAWSRGVASFWRLLGLLILLAVAGAVLLAILLLLLVVPALLAFTSEDNGLTAPLLAFLLVGILLVLLLVPAGIVIQIVLNYAIRSLVLAGTGVFASLRVGGRVFRRNLGTSLVLWVLDLALSAGVGLLIAVPVAALAVPLIMGGILLEDLGPPVLAAGLLLALLMAAALALIKAVGSTFLAAYWTIAYRRLTDLVDEGRESLPPAPRSGPITVAPPEA